MDIVNVVHLLNEIIKKYGYTTERNECLFYMPNVWLPNINNKNLKIFKKILTWCGLEHTTYKVIVFTLTTATMPRIKFCTT